MKGEEEDYLYVPHVAVGSGALRVRQKIIYRRTLEGHLSILKAHIDAGRSVYCRSLALISHSMGYPTETTFPRTRTQNCATLRDAARRCASYNIKETHSNKRGRRYSYRDTLLRLQRLSSALPPSR